MKVSIRTLTLTTLLFALAATAHHANAACTLTGFTFLPLSPCEWQEFSPRT